MVWQLRPDALQIIHDAVVHTQQPGDGLGGIQHATTADADHDIVVLDRLEVLLLAEGLRDDRALGRRHRDRG